MEIYDTADIARKLIWKKKNWAKKKYVYILKEDNGNIHFRSGLEHLNKEFSTLHYIEGLP